MHAIHFCNHIQLKSFRKNIITLLDKKITELIQNITETQTATAAKRFIQSIENTLLRLHGLQNSDGRTHQTLYKTGKMWMQEKKVHTLEALQQSNIPIYAHIFGFVPVLESTLLEDSCLNTANCISLGVVPKTLDMVVRSLGDRLNEIEFDPTRTKTICAGYKTLWNEIKEINEAKVMGLHKIIGVVSKTYEKLHRKKHGIDKGSWKALKRSLENASDNGKCKILKKEHTEVTQIKIEDRKKFCTGITCNRRNSTWNFGLKPSLIRYNLKHCQRCAKQQTAFKIGAEILDTCIHQSTQLQNEDLLQHLDDTTNDINYSGIMKRTPTTKNFNNRSKMNKRHKKRKLTDAEKGTLKTISTCITKLTNCNTPTNERLKKAKIILQDTIISSKKFLKDDLKHNIDMNTALLENKSYNQKPIIITESGHTTQTRHDSNDPEEIRIRGDIASALVNNQWMFSYSLDRAIKNIRMHAPNNVFIANTGISTILQTWQPTHGWRILASHFRSIQVSNKKPHGTYIMPLFSGAVTSGHWSMTVIWKQKRMCKGWILDSMGKGDIHSAIAKILKKVFGKAKTRCRWQEVECRQQQEVECGEQYLGW